MFKIFLLLLVCYVVFRLIAAWWARYDERLRRTYWLRSVDSSDRQKMLEGRIEERQEEQKRKQDEHRH